MPTTLPQYRKLPNPPLTRMTTEYYQHECLITETQAQARFWSAEKDVE
jgi:hypothetical protein